MERSPNLPSSTAFHVLLLLSDSALPLGSFAFSSGLESFLAHRSLSTSKASSSSASSSLSSTTTPRANTNPYTSSSASGPHQFPAFQHFLRLSVASLASTALPYVLAAYRSPSLLEDLDNDFDASTPCSVARRASTAQGRALLSVWERSYRGHYDRRSTNKSKKKKGEEGNQAENDRSSKRAEQENRVVKQNEDDESSHDREDEQQGDEFKDAATSSLLAFQGLLRSPSTSSSSSSKPPPELLPNAHLPPLWGVVTRALGLPLSESVYLFLFSHARTVVSAGVRASVLGPYQAQSVLADGELQERIERLVEEWWDVGTEEAGQCVPSVDLWMGRHEKLYSRIFNS